VPYFYYCFRGATLLLSLLLGEVEREREREREREIGKNLKSVFGDEPAVLIIFLEPELLL